MRFAILALLILFSVVLSAQNDTTIEVYSKTIGKHVERKLIYYEMVNVIPFKSLGIGKHRFYINVDKDCQLSLVAEKSPVLTVEETLRFNEFISKHRVVFYDNDVLITDCKKYSNINLPISIFIE